MTGFDAILIVIFAVSIFFAVIRGAVREFGTLIALLLGGLIAWMFTVPILSSLGKLDSFFANVFTAGSLTFVGFVGFHVLISYFTGKFQLTEQQRLIDQVAGGFFGFVRALALVGLGFIGYGYYLDEPNRPDTVNNAMLLPLVKGSASIIEGFAPYQEGTPQPQDLRSESPSDVSSGPDRAAMEELVTTVTTSEPSDPKTRSTDQSDEIADLLTQSTNPDGN
ncbi:MAG: CvpA family protein [Pseudomonadota bacterium]